MRQRSSVFLCVSDGFRKGRVCSVFLSFFIQNIDQTIIFFTVYLSVPLYVFNIQLRACNESINTQTLINPPARWFPLWLSAETLIYTPAAVCRTCIYWTIMMPESAFYYIPWQQLNSPCASRAVWVVYYLCATRLPTNYTRSRPAQRASHHYSLLWRSPPSCILYDYYREMRVIKREHRRRLLLVHTAVPFIGCTQHT